MFHSYIMSPNQWGPPTWTLFHTIAEKMNEEAFPVLMPQFIFFLKRICSVLPCPECSQHATQFWKNINVAGIKTKTDMKNMLFLFHNIVNKRKGKPLFVNDTLSELYKHQNIINVFNKFVAVYQTKGNMQLLADSFQRKLLLVPFRQWVMSNIKHFT